MNLPEHEKLLSRKQEHEDVQKFCWYLESHGLLTTKETYRDEETDEEKIFYRECGSVKIQEIIADYFGIDLEKFHKEKDHLLKSLQNAPTK